MNISPAMPISYQTNFTHNSEHKGLNPVTWTGYSALAAGVASGIAGNKKKIKVHKKLAYIAGIVTGIHLGIVEMHKYQYKKLKSKPVSAQEN